MKTENVLFVCTGNVCRSAMAEALARRAVPAASKVIFRSAGLIGEGMRPPPETVEVLEQRGVEVSGHRSTLADVALETEPDLVVTMAREHLREIAAIRPDLFPRTFTLKELVRRGEAEGPRGPDELLSAYLLKLSHGRQAAQLMGFGHDREYDVADPIGMSRHVHETTAAEIEDLVERLTKLFWRKGWSLQ